MKVSTWLRIAATISFTAALLCYCRNTIIIPAGSNFDSDEQRWNFSGDYRETYGTIHLKQKGNSITGSGSHDFIGNVTGNRMEGTWFRGGSSGPVYFVMSQDGKYLRGAWGSEEIDENNVWLAERIGTPVACPGRTKEKPAATSDAGPTVPGTVQNKEIIAVFDVHDASGRLEQPVLLQLTTYLSTAMTSTGKFKVIPRDQLRKRLLEQKGNSYKTCFEQSCQIELGKAVAAQKSLATQLLKVGEKCAVTANLFDLKTETSEKGTTINTGCGQDKLLDAMQQVARQMAGR